MSLSRTNRVAGGAAASSSSIVSAAGTHAAGCGLVAMFSYDRTGGDFSSISNTALDTWTQAVAIDAVNNHNKLAIYYVSNSNGNASDVVTVSLSAGTVYRSIAVYSIAGQLTTDMKDNTSSGQNANTAYATGSVVCSAAQDIICAFAVGTPTISNAAYNVTNFAITGDATAYFADGYKVVTASEAASFTGGNTDWAMVAASFKVAPSAGFIARSGLQAIQAVNRSRTY